MPTTPVFSLPYPSLTDAPNGPSQIQSLATATETAITGRTTTLTQWGTATVHVTANGTYTTVAVAFPVAFSAPPAVTVSPLVAGTGAITSQGYDSVTTTGCNVGVVRTGSTVPVDTVVSWIAVGPR